MSTPKKPSRIAQLVEQHKRGRSGSLPVDELAKSRKESDRELLRLRTEVKREAADLMRNEDVIRRLEQSGNALGAKQLRVRVTPIKRRIATNIKLIQSLEGVKAHDESIQHALKTQQTVKTMATHARQAAKQAEAALGNTDELYMELGESVAELNEVTGALTQEDLPADVDPEVMFGVVADSTDTDECDALISSYLQASGITSYSTPIAANNAILNGARSPGIAQMPELPPAPQHPILAPPASRSAPQDYMSRLLNI